MDYVEYANLGTYLFETVRVRFQEQGYLNAFDFFSIVIWKANRAKSNVAKMLTKASSIGLENLVKIITNGVANAPSPKEKLRVLWSGGFRLPMASAILTVLYPEEFTVYDYRVCDELEIPKILDSIRSFDMVWEGYTDFKAQVIANTPSGLSLRDKDLYLWGKSRCDQLIKDISNEFQKNSKQDEEEDEQN
jgi:hypothetical protein